MVQKIFRHLQDRYHKRTHVKVILTVGFVCDAALLCLGLPLPALCTSLACNIIWIWE